MGMEYQIKMNGIPPWTDAHNPDTDGDGVNDGDDFREQTQMFSLKIK